MRIGVLYFFSAMIFGTYAPNRIQKANGGFRMILRSLLEIRKYMYNDSTGKYIGKFVFPMLLWTCDYISLSSVIPDNPALLRRVNVGAIQKRRRLI